MSMKHREISVSVDFRFAGNLISVGEHATPK